MIQCVILLLIRWITQSFTPQRPSISAVDKSYVLLCNYVLLAMHNNLLLNISCNHAIDVTCKCIMLLLLRRIKQFFNPEGGVIT